MITAIQKYVCIQTGLKKKNANSCVRVMSLWVNFFSFVSFPLMWLQLFIFRSKEKSQHVYTAAQLTLKNESGIWVTNVLVWVMGQYLSWESLFPFFAWVPLITSQPAKHVDEESDAWRGQMTHPWLCEATRWRRQDGTPDYSAPQPWPSLCESDPRTVHTPPVSHSSALQLKAQMVGPNPDLVNQRI